MNPNNIQTAVSVSMPKNSKNDGIFYEIEMIDNGTGQLRKTFVVPGHKNYFRWEKLMKYMDNNPDLAVCLDGNFRAVKNDETLIDADSTFNHLEDYDRREFLDMVSKVVHAN